MPEFSGLAVVAFSALAASLYVVRSKFKCRRIKGRAGKWRPSKRGKHHMVRCKH